MHQYILEGEMHTSCSSLSVTGGMLSWSISRVISEFS